MIFLSERSDDDTHRDQSQRNRDQRYSVRGQSQQTLSCDSVTFKTDSTGIFAIKFLNNKIGIYKTVHLL